MAGNTYPDRKGGTMIHWGTSGFAVMRIETRGLTAENIPIIVTSAQVADSAEKVEMMDGDGETVGMVVYNPKKTITLSGHITATTIATALTSMDGGNSGTAFDDGVVGDQVEFDFTNCLLIDDAAGRKWVIDSMSWTFAQAGLASFDLTAIEYANDLSGAATP